MRFRGKQIRKKQIAVLLVLTLILAGAGLLSPRVGRSEAVPAAAQITNWGLRFQEEGKAPVGNADSDYLRTFDAVYRFPTEEKVLYLTFDAGYENGNMEKILEALNKHDAKAVFFLVGNYFETQPELVKRMEAEGHTVGNHTYSHPDLARLEDPESFRAELEKNEALYREVTGGEMTKLYRPPQGKFCEENLKMAQELGYHTVFWSLAYVDWYVNDQPTPEEAFSKLLPRVHPGAVVLLHSTSATNGAILDELLTRWEQMGYRFGDLPAALGCGEQTPSFQMPELFPEA